MLIALHDVENRCHRIANEWFAREGRKGWATCPLTENGFVRIASNIGLPERVQGISASMYLLESLVRTYGSTHRFWPDSVSLRDKTLLNEAAIRGPKQITDVYLLALCQRNGGVLVTLDTRITVASIVDPHPELLRILR